MCAVRWLVAFNPRLESPPPCFSTNQLLIDRLDSTIGSRHFSPDVEKKSGCGAHIVVGRPRVVADVGKGTPSLRHAPT